MKNWFLYIIVTLIIFVSDDTYLFGTSGIETLLFAKYAFFVCLPLVLLSKKLNRLNKALVLFFIVLIFSAVANINSFGLGIIIIFLLVLSSFLLCRKYSLPVFTTAFSNVVLAICIYSLTVYLLTIILGVFETSVITNMAGRNIQYSFGCLLFGHYGILVRLSSFFREPGVFMVYINLALLFDLFINKNKLIVFRIVIYALSILSSFSTGGLATFATIIVLYGIKARKFIYSMITGLFLLIGVFFVLNNEDVYAMFFNKLEGGLQTSSSLGRVSSIFIPFKIWIDNVQNFLFGCGIKDFNDEYVRMGKLLYHTTIDPEGLSTNTIFNSLAIFGVGFGFLLLIGLYKFSKLFAYNILQRSLALLVFLFIFSNENMVYSLPIYIFVMYGFDASENKNNKLNEAVSLSPHVLST